LSRFTVLPIQIFNWVSRPQAGFHEAAAAGIIVLLVVLLVMNTGAVILRNKFQKRMDG
jgi:phosphate transport system permease protein